MSTVEENKLAYWLEPINFYSNSISAIVR